MNDGEFLFIGGTNDGRRITVTPHRELVFPVIKSSRVADFDLNSDPYKETSRREYFTMRRFLANGKAIEFYGEHSLDDWQLMTMLLHNYKPEASHAERR